MLGIMHLYKKLKFVSLIALLTSSQAIAQQATPLFNFKFNHISNTKSTEFPSADSHGLKFKQSDVSWLYPWEDKNVNVDLGVTLRYLSGETNSAVNNVHFHKTLPLLHASALFNLSLKGLSAGVEGKHLSSKASLVFDYRAKVSYEWRNGFGMQGGWQHQQFSLDKSLNTAAEYESIGPYIDFYLNF